MRINAFEQKVNKRHEKTFIHKQLFSQLNILYISNSISSNWLNKEIDIKKIQIVIPTLWGCWYNYHQVFIFRTIIVHLFAFTWNQFWVFAQAVLSVSPAMPNDSNWEHQERACDQGEPTQKECRRVSPCGVNQPTYTKINKYKKITWLPHSFFKVTSIQPRK